jgi:hypothetical protein
LSKETVILLVAGYVGLLTLIMCLLVSAKRDDEAAAWQREQSSDEPRGRDAA